ncbi:rhodanese-like domain-containing protein [Tomitella cavernea]|nr:rhodanese-like domain-containing protein [Tomitella cavernea]
MADGTDPQAAGYAGDVTPARAWEMLGDDPRAVLVDVRTGAEWQFVGVPDLSALGRRTRFVEWIDYPSGAPNPQFGEQLQSEVAAERGAARDGDASGSPSPILFLCRSGQRSIGAATAATGAGMGPAYNVLEGFEGGLDAHGHRGSAGWRAAGLPWCQS